MFPKSLQQFDLASSFESPRDWHAPLKVFNGELLSSLTPSIKTSLTSTPTSLSAAGSSCSSAAAGTGSGAALTSAAGLSADEDGAELDEAEARKELESAGTTASS